MYAQLAKTNIRKAIKDYLIYFITITICVSLFYAITSLSSSSYELITEESYNFRNLKLILQYSTYVITAILIFLVAYVNKYMIGRRKREFATYVLLGAEQNSISMMFFIETIVVGVLAIIAGIFVGTLFSQAITAMVLISAKQEVVFSIKLYLDTVAITFIFFISMFCIIGLYNIIALRKIKLIDMLNAHKQVEFQFKRSKKVYISIFVVSIIMYIISGSYTVKLINSEIDYSVKLLIYIGISLITFIIGTYALFYSISYIMICIKNKWVNFKYEGTNLFLIGSIVSKVKTAPILMATISITFLGAMISFIMTLVMSQWAMGYLDMRVPYDIDIRNNYSTNFLAKSNIDDIKVLPKLDYSEIVEYLNNNGAVIESYCQVKKYIISYDESTLAIKLSDFNKLRAMLGYNEIELKDNEFTTQWHNAASDEVVNDYVVKNSNLNINGITYNISQDSSYKDSIGEGFYSNSDNIIILPDRVCDNLDFIETNFVANIENKMKYEEANEFRQNYIYEWFRNNNSKFVTKYSNENDITDSVIDIRIKSLEINNILTTTLAMRILGVYLGIVLLMISLTILSLSQLTESIEHKDRFNVLGKLGVEEDQINKIILKQISIYFIVPIAIAMIGAAIFIYNYYIIYNDIITIFVGNIEFILSIIFGVALMLVIYMCYFIGTYYTFKRNININLP